MGPCPFRFLPVVFLWQESKDLQLRSLPINTPHKYFNLVMVVTHSISLCLKRKGFYFSVQLMYFTSFGIQATNDWELKLIYGRFELDTSCCFLFFNQLPLVSLHLQRSQECSHDWW